MKAKKDKVYFIISNSEHVSIKIDDNEVKSSDGEKLIGVKIDSKLNLTVCMKNVYVLHIVTIDHPANIC